jgi:hypothetical protein
VTNPTSLQYNENTGEIYLVGRGNYYEDSSITEDFHSGGVVAVDPTTYEPTLLLDDGSDADNQGYFVELEVIDSTSAYLLTYASFGVTTLRTFNTTSGVLMDDTIAELQDSDLTSMAAGPDNHLWVGVNDNNPGFYRIDLATGELAAERVDTELVPSDIVFINATQR